MYNPDMPKELRARLDADLAALNAAVTAALKARRDWMDAHMQDYARYQVGEEIFDMATGRRLGVVSELYRYQSDQNPFYDTHMSVDYQYNKGGNCFDNTSRQIGLSIGNAEELAAKLKSDAEHAAWRLTPEGRRISAAFGGVQ